MNGKITFDSLLDLLKKNFHTLIWWMIGCFAVTAIFTVYLIVPMYQATSRIVVNQTESSSANITSTDISTNISLINTYQSIIMEPIILEEVLSKTASDDSLQELSNKITFQNDQESLVFGITVEDEDPYMAAELANSISEIFQTKIGEILPVQSVTILSEAVPNTAPISPNVIQNLLFGALLGLFIGLLQIFLKTLLDKRVKSLDIIHDLEWSNLGSVSEMSNKEIHETALRVEEEEAEEEAQLENFIENKRVGDNHV